MSERQDDAQPSPEGEPASTPASEEPVRRTDGQRWEASVAGWSEEPAEDAAAPTGSTAMSALPDGTDRSAPPAGDDEAHATREIQLGDLGAPEGQPAASPEGPAAPWEQPAAWQQAPAWDQSPPPWEQQPAPAGWDGAPADAPRWEQPAWQQPSWEQQPAWQQPSWEQPPAPQRAPREQAPQQHRNGQPPAAQPPAPAAPQPGGQQLPWEQAPQQQAPQQQAGPYTPQPTGPPVGGAQTQDRPTPPPSLTSQSLLRTRADTPTRGWRKFVHKATAGSYNPGLSAAELEHRALVARVTTPVRGSNRIAVVSLKGGIGKTTTTSCLGLTLAHHRGDRVVAVDANPDAGTLAERLTNVIDVTVRDLLANIDSIRSFTDVSAFTSLAGRLQVLASDQDPALSEAFSEEQYRAVADILARYFNIIITDSGTGLLHSAMSGTLAIADSLVVVGAPSVDGASRASKTLDWLIAHGHEELVARSVAVISSVRPNTGDVDMDLLRQHFGARCRAVVEIPYDSHLVTGGLIDLQRVGAPAQQAFLELAARVADGFALPPLQRSVARA